MSSTKTPSVCQQRAPSQFRQKEFYWRGGDPLKEQEHLYDEFKKTLAQHRKLSMINKQLKSDIELANSELAEKLGYVDALSSFLDPDVDSSAKEQELKNEISSLENEIRKKENMLSKTVNDQNPAILAALERESAFLLVEIQRVSKMIANNDSSTEGSSLQLTACLISDSYQYASQLEYKIKREERNKALLRQRLNQIRRTFDSRAHRTNINNGDYYNKQRDLMNTSIHLKIDNKDSGHSIKWRQEKYQMHIDHLLNQIKEINERLENLGMEEDMANLSVLKEKYSPQRDAEQVRKEKYEEESKKLERGKQKKKRLQELLEEDRRQHAEKEAAYRKQQKEMERQRREEQRRLEEKRDRERKEELARYERRKANELRRKQRNEQRKKEQVLPTKAQNVAPDNEKAIEESKFETCESDFESDEGKSEKFYSDFDS